MFFVKGSAWDTKCVELLPYPAGNLPIPDNFFPSHRRRPRRLWEIIPIICNFFLSYRIVLFIERLKW